MDRCFFGLEVVAPWPKEFPQGRTLQEEHRHLTLAFLGNIDLACFSQQLSLIPLPSFQIGLAAWFNRPVFFPLKNPRIAGYHVQFFDEGKAITSYQQELISWLQVRNFSLRFHSSFHITIARSPFLQSAWEEHFQPLPLYLNRLCLYESLPGSQYRIRWEYPFLPPFEEREHTADLAFLIRGASLLELYLHAALALAFVFPPFISFLYEHSFQTLELEKGLFFSEEGLLQIVSKLNQLVAIVDAEKGCPFKAVSFHGTIEKTLPNLLEWEMIVDV